MTETKRDAKKAIFLTLPTEIRREIYKHVWSPVDELNVYYRAKEGKPFEKAIYSTRLLDLECERNQHAHKDGHLMDLHPWRISPSPSFDLLRTAKQLDQETYDTLVRTFRPTTLTFHCSSWVAFRFLKTLPWWISAHIRNMHFLGPQVKPIARYGLNFNKVPTNFSDVSKMFLPIHDRPLLWSTEPVWDVYAIVPPFYNLYLPVLNPESIGSPGTSPMRFRLQRDFRLTILTVNLGDHLDQCRSDDSCIEEWLELFDGSHFKALRIVYEIDIGGCLNLRKVSTKAALQVKRQCRPRTIAMLTLPILGSSAEFQKWVLGATSSASPSQEIYQHNHDEQSCGFIGRWEQIHADAPVCDHVRKKCDTCRYALVLIQCPWRQHTTS